MQENCSLSGDPKPRRRKVVDTRMTIPGIPIHDQSAVLYGTEKPPAVRASGRGATSGEIPWFWFCLRNRSMKIAQLYNNAKKPSTEVSAILCTMN
jgi:hypothetical protein